MTLVNQAFHYDDEPSIADYHRLIACLYLPVQMCLINTAASEDTLIITKVNNCNKSPCQLMETPVTIMVMSNESYIRFKPC